MIVQQLERYKNSLEKRAQAFIAECLSYGMTEKEARRYVRQKIAPGVTVESMPTLALGIQHTVSPQLKARFAYAGSWQDLGEHLLDPAQMDKLVQKSRFRKWLKSMREDWEDSAPWLYPDEAMSVVSVANEQEGDFTLLVWGDADEPEVWRYTGQSEQRFADLVTWLVWLNGG